jgi:hypothetical protein
MGLFRRKGPVVFEPRGYSGSRSRWRLPRWLVILVAGVALGAGGLWLVQARYGPKRLSLQEARELQERVVQLDGERGTLQADLDASNTQLQGTRAENRTLAAELAAVRQTAEQVRYRRLSYVDEFGVNFLSGIDAYRNVERAIMYWFSVNLTNGLWV